MCGIVGVIGSRPAAPLILDSLRRLEYRGYDSAGIATLVNGHIDRRRAEGKLGNLAAALDRFAAGGHDRHRPYALGDARRADRKQRASARHVARLRRAQRHHREPRRTARRTRGRAGRIFTTETDTETVAQLVDLNLQRGMDPVAAAGAAFHRLEGAYALAMIFSGHPELIVGAQHGAPLAVGFGENEMFVGSDGLALAPLTQRIAYLSDGDWTVVDRKGARFFGADGDEVQREVKLTRLTGAAIGKGNFRHFMEKELHEHPAVIGDTLHRMVNPDDARGGAAGAAVRFRHAAAHHHQRLRQRLLCRPGGRWWFEAIARIPTDADVASEFRYRTPPLPKGGLGHAGQPVRRDRRHAWRRCATCASRASTCCRSSTCRRAAWRASVATPCWRRWPGRRSASPAPRRSPRSLRCWRAWRSRAGRARGAISVPRRRRR